MNQPTLPPPAEAPGNLRRLLTLGLGALGVVYGDIGTSPLYTLQECFARHGGEVAPHAVEVTAGNVLGVLSLVFWALTMVITVKYIAFILLADNKGEGGIFALLALVPGREVKSQATLVVVLAGLLGAALLYGDAVITPAITVLSAMEGLALATDIPHRLVVLLTLAILLGLFLVQRKGTAGIGRVFGPVMLVWFLALAALGARGIAANPTVLAAVNPAHAVALFAAAPARGFAVLGSVVLCITGGEALYADLGHFRRKPIRLAWLALVFPSLLLNYFGQGALLLTHGWVEKPFWALVPEAMLYPMVALATAAAVIASQALISGAFSLTRQAVQLGYLPRVTIIHTSAMHEGQIYVPAVNTALMVACLALVLAFQHSSALTAAYGLAVTGTMAITSVLFFHVVTKCWNWSWWRTGALLLLFLSFDIPFFVANGLKFFDGGWFPVVLGASLFTIMTTWKRGRAELAESFNRTLMPLENLLEDLTSHQPPRVRGTAVFMSSSPTGTPPVLLHHLKHNQVLHRQVVLLSITPRDVPVVPKEEQLEVEDLGQGFYRLQYSTGFMETPHVPTVLKRAREQGLVCEPSTTSFFLGRETLLTGGKSPLMKWRKALFAFLSRNALSATSYFGLPPGRVVELGMQVDL